MIIKFKPSDFEECLMGMPIENWLLVDEDILSGDDYRSSALMRPKMQISHLEELHGIYEKDDKVHIKCYTSFDEIYASEVIPDYFIAVLTKAKSISLVNYKTLGCYLSSVNFDRLLYPMLVAVDAVFILKSYIKERKLDFRKFTLTGKIQFANRNEVMYEMIIPKIHFTDVIYNAIEFEDIQGDSRFSYFIGLTQKDNIIEKINFTIMLPNKSIIRASGLESFLTGRSIVMNEQIKTELLELYYATFATLRIQLRYKQNALKIFNKIVWQPLLEILRGRDDEERTNTNEN